MASDRDRGATPPGFLQPDPTKELPETTDPATDRVSGVELGGHYELTYDWLDEQFEPTAAQMRVSTHGGSLRHAGLIDDPELSELDDGLGTMETFPAPYQTPADLLSEYVARKYTIGRREFERIRELDQRLRLSKSTLSRVDEQESAEATRGVLITLGEQLLTLGAFLFGRYETFEPTVVEPGSLPLFPNPRRADAVTEVLAAYDEALPRAGAAETLLTTPPGPVDGVHEARDTLALAVAAIFYARWDAAVDDCWPLPVGEYPVHFSSASPVTGMESLTEYRTEGIVNDVRTFDERLAESADRFYEGEYLDEFRRMADRYREVVGDVGV
jgi:hypothetical protein